jgi:hypothetical protein
LQLARLSVQQSQTKHNFQTQENTMKKIALTLVAVAALSTAAFAGDNRNWDLRDSPDNPGHFTDVNPSYNQVPDSSYVDEPSVSPFAAPESYSDTGAPTNQDIMRRNMIKNESSSH